MNLKTLFDYQLKEYNWWMCNTIPKECYNNQISWIEQILMNQNTVRQQLNIYLGKGKINFYQLKNIIREIEQSKLMKDLTKQEKDLIDSYINN